MPIVRDGRIVEDRWVTVADDQKLPDDAPAMGEDMPLAVDMTRACLFDPATQRLI